MDDDAALTRDSGYVSGGDQTADRARVGEATVTSPVPVRVLIRSIARLVLGIAVLLAAYLLVPVQQESTAVSAVTWAALLALVGLVGVFAHQMRRINRSRYPLIDLVTKGFRFVGRKENMPKG